QATDRITADVKLVPSGQALSDAEQRAVSFSAGRILKHVEQAKQALVKKDKPTALAQIEKGLRLVTIIEQTIPPVQVTATITAGTLQYQDEDQVKRLVVPIYQELDTVSLVEPVVAAKKEAASKDSPPANKTAAHDKVEELGESYASITLNVEEAKAHLVNAKEALTKGNFDAAAKDLATIQEGVTLVYAVESGPLANAREDLVLAQIYLDENRSKQAEQALKNAGESLSRYEKAGGKHQDDARTLRDEMAALSKDLAQEKQGPMEKVKEKLMGWWDRVRSWEARHF
ncbi:MAG: YfdX family protein, partial [Nitrospirales bacterium]